MKNNEINYIMDKCIEHYQKASKQNDIFLAIRLKHISAGNALKEIIEEFIDKQPKKKEFEKYMKIIEYYQKLNS